MFPSEGRSFEGFGPTGISSTAASTCDSIELSSDRASARKLFRERCPKRPGVYGMWDAEGELIYVGKAKSLKNRLSNYFGAKSAEEKSHRILSRARILAWEHTHDEFGALVRELELIRRWRPRFNVQGQPGRASRGFICLGRAPAPYFYLAAQPSRRTVAAFGPVSMGGKSREAVRRLNDLFLLRDCKEERKMSFSDQQELFAVERTGPCIRYELGTCAGPCIAACSRQQYAARVREAKAFLNGKDLKLLDQLQAEMLAASKACQFERAAQLRDTWELLERVVDNLEYLKHVRAEYFFVYPVASFDGPCYWYLIRGGVVVDCIPAPVCDETRTRASTMVEQVFSSKVVGSLEQHSDFGQTLLTAAWFRRHPEELSQTLTPFQAIEICGEPNLVAPHDSSTNPDSAYDKIPLTH